MRTFAVPLFAIADCITLDLIPELCRWAARKLRDTPAAWTPILCFAVYDTPRRGEKLIMSDAPERLLCVTNDSASRDAMSAAIKEVKQREGPRVAGCPRLRFRASLTLRKIFGEMAAARSTGYALIPENGSPFSVFFVAEAFTITELRKELDARL